MGIYNERRIEAKGRIYIRGIMVQAISRGTMQAREAGLLRRVRERPRDARDSDDDDDDGDNADDNDDDDEARGVCIGRSAISGRATLYI